MYASALCSRRLGLAACVLGLVYLAACSKKSVAAAETQPIPQPSTRSPQSIVVSYKGLVDTKQVTQAGQTIGATLAEGVHDRYQRGQLQPFLEGFSKLLPVAVVTAQGGPSNLPHINVLDELPKDAPVPAWVSLLKGGEFVVTDDGDGNASVYAPGENSKMAYNKNYGVLRHILQSLLPDDGRPLRVRTYAFTNDYGNCQIQVSLDPFLTSSTNFTPPPGKVPLNLEALNQFFQQNAQVQGGIIDSSNNLILVGKKSGKPTLSGQPVELSDLAAAYRAVFHSGDNLPFISLDPHTNPAMVNVNFGGYLEDTRLGSVVLESDKRFKTITTGLDPTSFNDLRRDIRKHIPTFASVGERELLTSQGDNGWKGTRFWFYPDSVEVQTSLDGQEGVISKAQFTADAERSRDDYKTTADFDRSKKAQLSPAIRMNIDDLNKNYSVYASVFPELNELSTVARLMGLCIWLQKNVGNKIDLDALLCVPMPNAPTQKEKRQLVTSLSFAQDRSKNLGLDEAEDRSILTYLTPSLDQSVNSVFPEAKSLAEFLAISRGNSVNATPNFFKEASVTRQYSGNSQVVNLITNETCLEAFASVVGGGIKAPAPTAVSDMEKAIDSMKPQIDYLKQRIEKIEAIMNQSSPEVYNSYVSTHNQLAAQERELVGRFNAEVDRYNQIHIDKQTMLDISGGIGLEPDKFKVTTRETSPELETTKKVARGEFSSVEINGEEWVKSNPSTVEIAPRPKLKLSRPWKAPETHNANNNKYFFSSTESGDNYWRRVRDDSGWQDDVVLGQITQERYYDSSRRMIQIAEFNAGIFQDCIVGRLEGDRIIIFDKSSRQDILSPVLPPHWWN